MRFLVCDLAGIFFSGTRGCGAHSILTSPRVLAACCSRWSLLFTRCFYSRKTNRSIKAHVFYRYCSGYNETGTIMNICLSSSISPSVSPSHCQPDDISGYLFVSLYLPTCVTFIGYLLPPSVSLPPFSLGRCLFRYSSQLCHLNPRVWGLGLWFRFSSVSAFCFYGCLLHLALLSGRLF